MNNPHTRYKILLVTILALGFASQARSQDSTALVSAFFGLDNAMPLQANFLCLGALGMDGMPVNFKYPIDASSLSASDFEVIDSLGNTHIPLCAVLAPANESGENRTVLLIGELGNATTNPTVEVRIVGDLFTITPLAGEYTCSDVMNLNGLNTTNIVRLADGPSLFFAQKVDSNLNECSSGTQTIQVAWNGGVMPYISDDQESDLFQYYTGYSDSAGTLIPHVPISIADLNDNDNFHQLCFSTNEKIVKISMLANTVEDPNGDPNQYSEIEVTYCANVTSTQKAPLKPAHKIYPNPFSSEIFLENLTGDEYFLLHDFLGRIVTQGKCISPMTFPEIQPGTYYLTIIDNDNPKTYPLIKL